MTDRNQHFDRAVKDLGLDDKEQALYQRHLSNLWGEGGVSNNDGSRSSLFQAVEPHNGKYYNIPTVWDGKIETEKWTRPSDNKEFDVPNKTALDNVNKAGWDSFPSYDDPQKADDRYASMHDYMDKDTGDWMAQSGAFADQ